MSENNPTPDAEGFTIEVPGFTIVRVVGAGGFGSVYEAVQDNFGSRVALKVLHSNSDQDDASRRQRREYLSMGRLRDLPGVVPVFGTTTSTSGHPVIIMGFMGGGSLRDRVSTDGPLTIDGTLSIAATLANVLESAHRLKIHHRDVKPENVLFDDAGSPFLGDFGLATMEGVANSSATVASLSPPHAPPERFTGDESDPVAGDIYSLCSTIYFMLTGRPPFGTTADGGLAGLIARITAGDLHPVDRSDLDERLAELLAEGLSRDPRNRPSSAGEVRDRLVAIAAHRGTAITVRTLGATAGGRRATDAERTRRVSSAGDTEPLHGIDDTRRISEGEIIAIPADDATREVGRLDSITPVGDADGDVPVLGDVEQRRATPPPATKVRRVAVISVATGAALVAGLLVLSAMNGSPAGAPVTQAKEAASGVTTTLVDGPLSSGDSVDTAIGPEIAPPEVPTTKTPTTPPTTQTPTTPPPTPPPPNPNTVSCTNPGVAPTIAGLSCQAVWLSGDARFSTWSGNGQIYEVSVEPGLINCGAASDCPFVISP